METRKSSRIKDKPQISYAEVEENKEPVQKKQRKTAPKKVDYDSNNEEVETPDTPEVTQQLIQKRPWYNSNFLDKAIEHLKSPTTITKINPKMLVLVGPPASGKTTVKRQLGLDDAVNLDVDELKIFAVSEFGNSAKGIFTDFRKLIQLLIVKIISQGYDVILDTTGTMKEEIKYSMKKAKAANYTIDIAIVYSTMELCKQRAAFRNDNYKARDPMPTFIVGKTYVDFTDAKRAKSYIMGIKDIVEMTNNLYLFDNSRCSPEAALILEKHGEQVIVHEDFPDFYGIKISQVAPHLVGGLRKKKRKTLKKKIRKQLTKRRKY